MKATLVNLPVRDSEALAHLHPLALLSKRGIPADLLRRIFPQTAAIGKRALTRLGRMARQEDRSSERCFNVTQYLIDNRSLDDAVEYLKSIRAGEWLVAYLDYLADRGLAFPGQPSHAQAFMVLMPIRDASAPFALACLLAEHRVFLSPRGEWLPGRKGSLAIRLHSEHAAANDEALSLRVACRTVDDLLSYNHIIELFRIGLRQKVAEVMLQFAPQRLIERLYEQCCPPELRVGSGIMTSSPKSLFRDPFVRMTAVALARAFESESAGACEPNLSRSPELLLRTYRRYVQLTEAAGVPAHHRIDINRAWSILRMYQTQIHPMRVMRRKCGHSQLTHIDRLRRQPCPTCQFLQEEKAKTLPGLQVHGEATAGPAIVQAAVA